MILTAEEVGRFIQALLTDRYRIDPKKSLRQFILETVHAPLITFPGLAARPEGDPYQLQSSLPATPEVLNRSQQKTLEPSTQRPLELGPHSHNLPKKKVGKPALRVLSLWYQFGYNALVVARLRIEARRQHLRDDYLSCIQEYRK